MRQKTHRPRVASRFLYPLLSACLFFPVGCESAEGGTAEAKRLAEILKIEPGQSLADIGAGDGEMSVALAKVVGPSGHIYATEIEISKVGKIDRSVSEAGLENVTSILGSDTETGVETACCDHVILRVVYHHFSEPDSMRAELMRILKPGGRIAIVEFPPRGKSSRHGSHSDDVIAEMQGAGFELLEHREKWRGKDRYLLVFQKPALAQP